MDNKNESDHRKLFGLRILCVLWMHVQIVLCMCADTDMLQHPYRGQGTISAVNPCLLSCLGQDLLVFSCISQNRQSVCIQRLPVSAFHLPRNTEVTEATTSSFRVDSGNQTRVLMLVWQVFYPLDHLPSFRKLFLIVWRLWDLFFISHLSHLYMIT